MKWFNKFLVIIVTSLCIGDVAFASQKCKAPEPLVPASAPVAAPAVSAQPPQAQASAVALATGSLVSQPSQLTSPAIDKLPLDMLQDIFSYLLSPIDENGFLVTYVSPRNQEVVYPQIQAVCKKWQDPGMNELAQQSKQSAPAPVDPATARAHYILSQLKKCITLSLSLFKLPTPDTKKSDTKNPLLEVKNPLLTALCQQGSIDIEVLWPVLMRLPDAAKILLMQSIISNPENKTALTVHGDLGNTLLHVLGRFVENFEHSKRPDMVTASEKIIVTILQAVPNHNWASRAATMFQDEKHFVVAEWTSEKICRQKIKEWQQKNPGYRMKGLYNNADYFPGVTRLIRGPLASFAKRFIPYYNNLTQNHLNMLHALLLEGALVDEHHGHYTVLGYLCKTLVPRNQNIHQLAIQLFIDNKASLDAKDSLGGSALHQLCDALNDFTIKARLPVVKAFILAGANPEMRDNDDQRPIDLIDKPVLKAQVEKVIATARAQFLARASSPAQAGKQGPVTKSDNKAAER